MLERVYEPKFYTDKEIKNKAGIYQIRNLDNNKIYIGSSGDLYTRRLRHFKLLKSKKSKHHCKYLQNSFNKHGEKKFIFEVIEFCLLKDRYIIEQYWLDKFFGTEICYNENPKAEHLGFTEEIRKRMSENHADVSGNKNYFYDKHFCGKENPFYGKHHTEESKRKMSEAHKNKKLTEEHKYKISKNSKSKVKVINILTNEIFDSVEDFTRKTKLSRYYLRGRFLKYKDYISLSEEEKERRIYMANHENDKSIVKVSNGAIYKHLSECCRENNIDKNTLYKHLKNKIQNNQQEFMYYKDWLEFKENNNELS